MDSRDADALDNLLDEMARGERENHEQKHGQDLLAMIAGVDERGQVQGRFLLDTIGRAKLAEEGKAE